jgi:hypothetical protein
MKLPAEENRLCWQYGYGWVLEILKIIVAKRDYLLRSRGFNIWRLRRQFSLNRFFGKFICSCRLTDGCGKSSNRSFGGNPGNGLHGYPVG